VQLLCRALDALPAQIRDTAAASGRKIALRGDAGYFAGDLARAAVKKNMVFAIGAKRIGSMWGALAAIGDDAWADAIDMERAQVAVSSYKPAGWPPDTMLLIRRVKLDPDQVSVDPRSRRRRTLHPDQPYIREVGWGTYVRSPRNTSCCRKIGVETPSNSPQQEAPVR
jgi:hypothetical protein